MRKTSIFLALTVVLGFTQCRKEVKCIPGAATEGVHITLNVDGASRALVDPTNGGAYDFASVRFEIGDVIYVGYNNAYVGQLEYKYDLYSATNHFEGTVDISEPVGDQPLHFYFIGGKSFSPDLDVNNNEVRLFIFDQTCAYPVISYASSRENYTTANTSYNATMVCKCSIMRFNVTTPSSTAVSITGMKNQVIVDFTNPSAENGNDNGFRYVKFDDGGHIKMHDAVSGDGSSESPYEIWAVVLPQDALSEGEEKSAYNTGFIGVRPAIPTIEQNKYYDDGISMTVNSWDVNSTPLTFEAVDAGAKVKFSIMYNLSGVEYSTDGNNWNDYTSGTDITLDNVGDKVSFRGNISAYCDDKERSYFSCSGACYLYGNIMSLVNPTSYVQVTRVEEFAFTSLFEDTYNGGNIKSHPDKALVLPAMTLSRGCYANMFKECVGMTKAPDLPATELAFLCYNSMFYNCDALTTAPDLPATTLMKGCYFQMFWDCEHLNSVKCMATDISAESCTTQWLYNVSESGTFITPSATDWTENSEDGIPSGWIRVGAE